MRNFRAILQDDFLGTLYINMGKASNPSWQAERFEIQFILPFQKIFGFVLLKPRYTLITPKIFQEIVR